MSRWSFPVRCGLAVSVAGSFLFVAFCWTTNHLLSLDQAACPEMYRSRRAIDAMGLLCFALLTWVAGSFPTISILASWQLWGMRRCDANREPSVSAVDWLALYDREDRRLAKVPVTGLLVAVTSAACVMRSR